MWMIQLTTKTEMQSSRKTPHTMPALHKVRVFLILCKSVFRTDFDHSHIKKNFMTKKLMIVSVGDKFISLKIRMHLVKMHLSKKSEMPRSDQTKKTVAA